MHPEEEQEAQLDLKPNNQPILLTPTKETGKNIGHQLSTLHCSRQLEFVMTPTKQEPEMFNSLLSQERSGMIQELGMSESSRINQMQEMQSEMQEEVESFSGEADVQEFEPVDFEDLEEPTVPTIRVIGETAQQSQTQKERRQREQKHIRIHYTEPRPFVRACTCKRSGCLKKYCECFKAGQACSAECECESCRNTNHHEHEVHKPNTSAKVSCNCKKSECSKNYCECRSSGQLCWQGCRCLECKNTVEGAQRMKMLAMLSKTTAKKRHRGSEDD